MFKVKKLNIHSKYKNIAFINYSDAKKLSLTEYDRIKIINKYTKDFIICSIYLVDKSNDKIKINISEGTIGLNLETFNKLNTIDNGKVDILLAEQPLSLEYIKKKSKGERFTKEQLNKIIKDIVENYYTDAEKAFFILTCYMKGMSDEEISYLTEVMVNVGNVLDFKEKDNEIILDKHCIGGVPNNRTSMLIVPIITSLGLKMPKTSSRSITSPAGTADTMEVLANVELDINKIKEVMEKEHGFLIWGGNLNLSPADDILIQIEHQFDIDSEGQLIASILSKKKSVGSTNILIDIPVGKTAKIQNYAYAIRLKKKFEKIGKILNLKIRVIITDGSQPIGNGIGPLYEAEDVIAILKRDKNRPLDLEEKALKMAGILLEEAKVVKKNKGYELAKNVLDSGKAYQKFQRIIELQGKNKKDYKAKYSYEIKAKNDGLVIELNNFRISKLAFILGAPYDKVAGLRLFKKSKDYFKKGEILYKIYSSSKLKMDYAKNYINEYNIMETKEI